MTTSDVPVPDWGKSGTSGGGDVPIPEWGGGDAPPNLPDLPGSSSRPAYMKNPPKNYLAEQVKSLPGDLLSVADMVGSIPAGVVGTAAGAGFAIRGALKGDSTKEQSQMANLAFATAMDAYGSPFSKLLRFAGMGKSDEDSPSNVDAIMKKATSLLEKGGEWLEDKTGGAIPKEEVEFLANGVLSLGAGKGMKVGMERLAAKASKHLVDAASRTPEAEAEAARGKAQTSEDPQAAGKMAAMGEVAATKAVEAKTRLTDPKNLVLDPTTGELSEATPELGKPLPKPSSIESALDKVAAGRRFDMTAEERIAYKDFEDKPPVDLVDERGRPLRLGGMGRSQSGSIDPDLLGTGLIAKGVKWLSAQDLSELPPTIALGALLDKSKYTLKTLDRLPQGKAEFSKSHIEQELNRADVTEVEKATVKAALEGAPAGEKITAKDLMLGVKKAMGDFELTAEKTDEFADYGMNSIGRHTEGDIDWDAQQDLAPGEQLDATKGQVPATTTLYRLPEHMEVSDNNHFSDKRLFGWTRSFTEGGVRHVVEVQSDLAQRAGKTLTDENRAALEADKADHEQNLAHLEKQIEAARRSDDGYLPNTDKSFARLVREQSAEKVRLAEVTSKLRESSGIASVTPLLKNWPKRLIREELGDAADGFDGRIPAVKSREEYQAKQGFGPETEMAQETEELRVKGVRAPEDKVRFATADTVAKVEGWPEGGPRQDIQRRIDHLRVEISRWEKPGLSAYLQESANRALPQLKEALATNEEQLKALGNSRFSPEHQSIYDRYKRDIEKFLRQLGGKDYTDEHGHTWIEVPTPRRNGRIGGPRQMHGYATPEAMARLAAVGLGAWAGAYFADDDKWQHMLAGAFGAALLSKAKPISLAKAAARALGKDAPRMSIADPAREWDSYRRLWALDTNLLLKKMEGVLPKEKDRIAVLHAREAGPAAVAKLSPKQQAFAKMLDEAFNDRLWEGVDNDVLHSAVDNYVTHIWDWNGNNKNAVERFLASHGVGMSQATPFSKERSIPTYAQGKAAGLKPVSEDPLFILGAYSNSLINAIATKNLIGALKSQEVLNAVGKPTKLLLPADEAPRGYVSINHPSLRGFKVHPDIEAQMKLLFDTAPAGDWMKAAIAVSDTAKHMGISMSLFHGKSLAEAAVRAANNPLRALVSLPGIVAGTNEYLRELAKGSASPLVSDAIKDGLMFSAKGVGSEDGGAGFYPAMKGAAKFADSIIPHTGAPIRGFAALNKKLDALLWERLHPALKLYIYAEKRDQLLANSIKAAKKGGGPSLTKEQAGRIAASFSNDLEGGLNYQRIAMEAQTQFGRMVAEKSFTPAGRRGMQVAFFAPDWNISAVRMVAQALRPEGSIGGVLQPKTLADLHRQLVLRSALYYFIGFDSLNYALSGHHIWQNKDWTKIDMDPKGTRHLQIDKGMMEVPNMIRQPRQEFLNKLGFIPSETANQLADTEYLAPRTDKRTGQPVMGPPMEGGRVGHAVSRLLPFATKQSPTTGPVEEAATRLGIVQITGSTPETRAAKKLAEKRRQQRLRDERAKEGK